MPGSTRETLRGSVAGKMTIKSCGKAHAYCKVCKPDYQGNYQKRQGFGFQNPETKQKALEIRIIKGSHAGEKNPNWRGGRANSTRIGWNAARRAVWARDKVCRACGLPPYPNRKLDVHHIKPRRYDGDNQLSNLVGLHHACHMQVEINRMHIAFTSNGEATIGAVSGLLNRRG